MPMYQLTYAIAHPKQAAAFTLIELSIVLVIIGLLVGGVLVGQDLIQAAKLRSVVSEQESYITAVNTFRLKYNCLPGDCKNATTFWGEAHATPSDCVDTQGTGTETCDGNGDKIILPSTGSNELFRFWQQLANAGLIQGDYTGIQSATLNYSASTANSPKSKINALWFVYNWGNLSGSGHGLPVGLYNNSFEIGKERADGDPRDSFFNGANLYAIDTKVDDGMPLTGGFVQRNGTNGVWSCTTAANSSDFTATYDFSDDEAYCVGIFRDVF